jgi:hypothetical protein
VQENTAPQTNIIEVESAKKAFMIFDQTGSMVGKVTRLVKELTELAKTVEITYCYGKSKVKVFDVGTITDELRNGFGGGLVNFKSCLDTFNSTERGQYDLLYLIGDGDFDLNINSNLELSSLISNKDDVKILKATLIQSPTDPKDPKWKNVVEDAGFSLATITI